MRSLYDRFPSAAFPLFVVGLIAALEAFSFLFGGPSAQEMVAYFEQVYRTNPMAIIFLGALLETVFMLSLYLPGSFVIFLAVYYSNGSPEELAMVILFSCLGVITGLIVNYTIGRFGLAKLFNFLGADLAVNNMQSFFAKTGGKIATFLAGAHPNFLGLAMVTNGMAKTNPAVALGIGLCSTIFWVPLMIFVASLITEQLNRSAENAPYLLIAIFLVWAVLAMAYDWRRNRVIMGSDAGQG